jgi:hypothetical protein
MLALLARGLAARGREITEWETGFPADSQITFARPLQAGAQSQSAEFRLRAPNVLRGGHTTYVVTVTEVTAE